MIAWPSHSRGGASPQRESRLPLLYRMLRSTPAAIMPRIALHSMHAMRGMHGMQVMPCWVTFRTWVFGGVIAPPPGRLRREGPSSDGPISRWLSNRTRTLAHVRRDQGRTIQKTAHRALHEDPHPLTQERSQQAQVPSGYLDRAKWALANQRELGSRTHVPHRTVQHPSIQHGQFRCDDDERITSWDGHHDGLRTEDPSVDTDRVTWDARPIPSGPSLAADRTSVLTPYCTVIPRQISRFVGPFRSRGERYGGWDCSGISTSSRVG
jgi:hypothetical protein